jgi:hypothetical protein
VWGIEYLGIVSRETRGQSYNNVPCSRTSTTPPGRRTRFTSLEDDQDTVATEGSDLTSKRTPH